MGSLRQLAGQEKREERERDEAAYASLEKFTQPEIRVLLHMAGFLHPPYALLKIGRDWTLLDRSFDSMNYGFPRWPTTDHRTVSSLRKRGLIERTKTTGRTKEYRLSEQGQVLANEFLRIFKKDFISYFRKLSSLIGSPDAL